MTVILSVKIEGVGDSTALDLYRYATGLPAHGWDSGNLYVDALTLWPQEIATTISFRDFSSTISGMSVTLEAHEDIRRWLYDQGPEQIATFQGTTALSYELSASATDIKLDSSATGLAGTIVLLERECIKLTTHDGSGQYSACVRGVYSTRATAHSADGADRDVSVFQAIGSGILLGRRITLQSIADVAGAVLANEVVLWSGIITEVSAPSPDIISISADSTLSAIRRRKICQSLFTCPPPGRAWDVTTGRGAPLAASGSMSISIDGGKGAMSGMDYVVITSGSQHGLVRVPWWAVANQNKWIDQPLPWEDAEKAKAVTEFFHCNAAMTASTSALPLSGNILTLTLQILTTTDTGDNYDSGGAVNYDTGAGPNIGLFVPYFMVDVAGIEEVRDSLGILAFRNKIYLGIEGKPVSALDFLQKSLLGPLGCVLTCLSNGQITVVQLLDIDDGTATNLARSDMISPPYPAQSRQIASPIDKVEVAFDYEVGKGSRTDLFINGRRRNRHPFSDRSTLSLDLSSVSGTRQANGAGGEGLARFMAIRLAVRYAKSIPSTDLRTTRDKAIEIGDVVTVSHDKLYGAADGIRGLSEATHLCVGRRLNLETGTMALRLLYVGAVYFKESLIAPAAVVVSYNASNRKFTIGDGQFNTGQKDTVGITSGSKILITTRVHASRLIADTVLVVEGIGVNLIQIDSASNTLLTTQSITPVAGDLLKLAKYDNASTADAAEFVFGAGTDGTLGSGEDLPSQWSF